MLGARQSGVLKDEVFYGPGQVATHLHREMHELVESESTPPGKRVATGHSGYLDGETKASQTACTADLATLQVDMLSRRVERLVPSD